MCIYIYTHKNSSIQQLSGISSRLVRWSPVHLPYLSGSCNEEQADGGSHGSIFHLGSCLLALQPRG